MEEIHQCEQLLREDSAWFDIARQRYMSICNGASHELIQATCLLSWKVLRLTLSTSVVLEANMITTI